MQDDDLTIRVHGKLSRIILVSKFFLDILWFAAVVPSWRNLVLSLWNHTHAHVHHNTLAGTWSVNSPSPLALGVISCTSVSTVTLLKPFWEIISKGACVFVHVFRRHYTLEYVHYAPLQCSFSWSLQPHSFNLILSSSFNLSLSPPSSNFCPIWVLIWISRLLRSVENL